MSIVARNECDWLKEAASHTLGELYFPLLDETKKEHPYDQVSALIALASITMYWIWVFTEGEGLQQAFISLHSKVQNLIDEDPDKPIFETRINESQRWPRRLN
jgi:hypothetical protein